MSDNLVWTFFYGSNMDRKVLESVNYVPEQIHSAKLTGFDIVIDPLANLIRSESACVYGIVASSTHAELDRLYGDYVQAKLGETYLPFPVLCEVLDSGDLIPALCYLSLGMKPAQVSDEYLNKIIEPSRTLGFPEWYIQRLEEFRAAD